MDDIRDFHFTDKQWDKVAVLLEGIGRSRDNKGDRWAVELSCGMFVCLRPRIGKGIPAPVEAKRAWLKVAADARRLQASIAELPKAGAFDLSVLNWVRPGITDALAASLPDLPLVAGWAAVVQMIKPEGAPLKVSNKGDPLLDELLERLAFIWLERGGKIAVTRDGKLSKFLIAASTPALKAVKGRPLTITRMFQKLRRLVPVWIEKRKNFLLALSRR